MTLSRAQQVLWLFAALAIILSASGYYLVVADQQSLITNAQEIQLYVGDYLIVTSNQNSIQRVFLQGNLTAANYTQLAQYPTNAFRLTSSEPGTYVLKILFDLQMSYLVKLYVLSNQSAVNYISSGYQLSGDNRNRTQTPTQTQTTQTRTRIFSLQINRWRQTVQVTIFRVDRLNST